MPGDEQDTVGANHQIIIENVVDNLKYGLNSTHKPIIKDLLLDDHIGVAYSQQHVTGGNLKKLVSGVSSADALEFAVEYESDTTFVIYTFSKPMLEEADEGAYIEAYKTYIVYENGKWEATTSYLGEAPVVYSTPQGSFRSIDVKNWRRVQKTQTN